MCWRLILNVVDPQGIALPSALPERAGTFSFLKKRNKKLLSLRWPNSLAQRTLLTLLLGLVVVQGAGLTIHAFDRLKLQRFAELRDLGMRSMSIYRTVVATSPGERAAALREMDLGPLHARQRGAKPAGGTRSDGAALPRPDTGEHGPGAGAARQPAARRGHPRRTLVGPDQHRHAVPRLELAEPQRAPAAATPLALTRVPHRLRADDGRRRHAERVGGAPADRTRHPAGRSRRTPGARRETRRRCPKPAPTRWSAPPSPSTRWPAASAVSCRTAPSC